MNRWTRIAYKADVAGEPVPLSEVASLSRRVKCSPPEEDAVEIR